MLPGAKKHLTHNSILICYLHGSPAISLEKIRYKVSVSLCYHLTHVSIFLRMTCHFPKEKDLVGPTICYLQFCRVGCFTLLHVVYCLV
jgi:hypothetical protein